MARSLEALRALLHSDLTARALERMQPGSILTDSRNPGFRARRQGNGAPVLEVRYRHNGERRTKRLGQYRRHPNDASVSGPPTTVRAALESYHALLDTLERKEDPKALTVAQEAARERLLAPALVTYEQSLTKRQVVKRGEVMSLLRREMLTPLGNVPLDTLTRAALVKRFDAIEASGRPGTARELRTRAGVFLSFCVDRGLLPANPLAGWRRPRATRAERAEQHGRSLEDWELPILWRIASETKAGRGQLGAYLLARLLTGQRRSDLANMRWQDLDLDKGVWQVPEVLGKTRPLPVPLPRLVRVILRAQPRRGERVFFPHVKDPEDIGWSKLLDGRKRSLYATTKAAGMPPWMPGDLRKTFRTGLEDALGVPEKVAELMVGHGPKDELERIYSRAKRWPERVRAARLWALHICNVLQEERRPHRKPARKRAAPAKVVPLRRSA
jgi:integrase